VANGRYRHGATPPRPKPPAFAPAPPPPSYVPGQDPWAPVDPAPTRSQLAVVVAAIGAFVLVSVIVLLMVVVSWARQERAAPPGPERAFDDPVVRSTAGLACATLHEDLERIPRAPLTAPAARRRAAIDAENAAVERLVDRMRGLGQERLAADPPAADWVAGWEALVAARERYATSLGGPDPARFEVPLDGDGRSVPGRMSEAGACGVPLRLVLLLPETPAA